MRVIVIGVVLATSMGCATTSGGVNTTFYRVNADDCGQTAPVPNNILSDPAAVGGKMHRFDATKVPIARWSE